MIIGKTDPARECFGAYSLEGTMLAIGGVTADLAPEEGDRQAVITFGYCDGRIHRGLTGKRCTCAAEIIIPPRRYGTAEAGGSGGMSFGGDDGAPAAHTETVPVPLDTETVTPRLRPGSFETGEEGQNGAE